MFARWLAHRNAYGVALLLARSLVLAAGAAVLTGCGLGPGSTPAQVRLMITDRFGAQVLADLRSPRIVGQDTVMRLLQRNATVTTRYGGGFVQSIDGRAGGVSGGQPIDWFYYVNGIEAPAGASATRVQGGDRVWWDRHDWSATMQTPAVVGSFPEPFAHGSGGRRLPVRVECEDPGSGPCATVADRLVALGVPAAQALLGPGAGTHTLRVLVGSWPALRHDPAAALLERGPAASGVYARPVPSGRALAVLDARGRTMRVLGPGTGLVAATRNGSSAPVWVVTGTDTTGVRAAADALDQADLHARFALAVSAGQRQPLPGGQP